MKQFLAFISIVILSLGCESNPPSADVQRMWAPLLDSLGEIMTNSIPMKDSIGEVILDSTGTAMKIKFYEVVLTSEKSELDSLVKSEIHFWLDSMNKINTERLSVGVFDSKHNELDWISP